MHTQTLETLYCRACHKHTTKFGQGAVRLCVAALGWAQERRGGKPPTVPVAHREGSPGGAPTRLGSASLLVTARAADGFGVVVPEVPRRWGRKRKMKRRSRRGGDPDRAVVGCPGGVRRAATIRRGGAHRRWDADGFSSIRGIPWRWRPGAEVEQRDLQVRFPTPGDKQERNTTSARGREGYLLAIAATQ